MEKYKTINSNKLLQLWGECSLLVRDELNIYHNSAYLTLFKH